jgi:hypothetical protein
MNAEAKAEIKAATMSGDEVNLDQARRVDSEGF